MTIAKKTQLSADKKRFILYKEGLFYKCFNEGAIVFTKYVKPYKVSVKFIKTVNANVCSIRFPAIEVDKGKLSFDDISIKIGD